MASPFHDGDAQGSASTHAEIAAATNPFASAAQPIAQAHIDRTAPAGYQSGGAVPTTDPSDDPRERVAGEAERNFARAAAAAADDDDDEALRAGGRGSPRLAGSLPDENFLPAVPGSPDLRRGALPLPAPYPLSSVYAQKAAATAAAVASSGGAAGAESTALGSVDPAVAQAAAALGPDNAPVIRLYMRRWFALANFAFLAIMNNITCYSLAPVATLANTYYETDLDLSMLITVFFITYVLFSFPSSRFIEKHGMRAGLVVGSWAQATGTVLRCFTIQSVRGSGFGMVMFGQVIASLGQAFFINTPPLVASTWFGEQERTLATTIACNADAFGIALAYLISPAVVASDQHNIPLLLQAIAVTSVFMASITTILFPEDPPLPPSRAQYMKLRAPKPPPESWADRIRMFQRKGFVFAVVAFAVSETTVNAFATFMDYMLERFSADFVSYMGSAFILSGLVGSTVLGYVVDKYHLYKSMVLLSFVGSALSILFFTLLSSQDDPTTNPAAMAAALLLVGFWVTPLLPITIEVAVEVAYPVPESSTAAVQQVAGNLLSSGMIPLLMLLRNAETEDFTKADWVLLAIVVATGVFFVFFKAPYLRLRAEENHRADPTSALIPGHAGGHATDSASDAPVAAAATTASAAIAVPTAATPILAGGGGR